MYFDYDKEYCNLCSDVIDHDTHYDYDGYCKSCFKEYIRECEDCGELFHEEHMINDRCENCYGLYRDELNDECYV